MSYFPRHLSGRNAAVFCVAIMVPAPALAHLGHLGDLAGHSHWAGIALTGAAIALAGWRAAGSKNADRRLKDGEKPNDVQGNDSQDKTGDEVHA